MKFSSAVAHATCAVACAAVPAAALCGPGQPVTASDSALRLLAAARLQAQALAGQAAAGAIDKTPPVLHSIQVTGAIDAQAPGESVSAALAMTDDLSGIVQYAIDFRSPSGLQHVLRVQPQPVPSKNLTRTLSVGAPPVTDPPFSRFSEPGTWEADVFYVYDANGNLASYSQVELRKLGSTTFVVTNAAYDIVPPALVGGTIETPKIRLSKPPKGTPPGTLPYAGSEISMTDAGNGAISGGASARMTLCRAGCADSFVLAGVVSRTGQAASTMTIGTQLPAGLSAGSYEIFALDLVDGAGNEATYTSSDFGGETDFTQFFPQGVTVTIEE